MAHVEALVLAVLCGSACLDTGEPDVPRDLGAQDVSVELGQAAETDGRNQPPDFCALLPAEGACSLACDPEALRAEYVPPGVCVAFVCVLTDGRHISVHACHAAEE